jgi:hypothetical protein
MGIQYRIEDPQRFRYVFVYHNTIFNTKMKISMKNFPIYLGIFFLILFCVSSAGCIKLIHKNSDQSAAQVSSDNPSATPIKVSGSSSPQITTSVVSSDQQANMVDVVDPILPDDYYQTVRNLSGKNGETPQVPLRSSYNDRTPVYHLQYSPQFNATAIKVNVTHGPLVINFKATPKINDPRISFAIVTVRELPSKAVVAEERIDNYPRQDDTSSEENSKNEKQIEIFKEGLYHINVYGNQIDTDVKVFTSDSPNITSASASGTVSPQTSEEEHLG